MSRCRSSCRRRAAAVGAGLAVAPTPPCLFQRWSGARDSNLWLALDVHHVGVGALIVWYLRKGMPESPRWLEAHGRTEEAEKSAGCDRSRCRESTGRKLADVTNAIDTLPVQQTGRLADLFTRDILARTITGSVILIRSTRALRLRRVPAVLHGATGPDGGFIAQLHHLMSFGGRSARCSACSWRTGSGARRAPSCARFLRSCSGDLSASCRSDLGDADRFLLVTGSM